MQIPYEKMIQESGVYYPFKLFRKKTASEMVRWCHAVLPLAIFLFSLIAASGIGEFLITVVVLLVN